MLLLYRSGFYEELGIEKRREFNSESHLACIDYEKAVDKVKVVFYLIYYKCYIK
jgi:hypothetical protein